MAAQGSNIELAEIKEAYDLNAASRSEFHGEITTFIDGVEEEYANEFNETMEFWKKWKAISDRRTKMFDHETGGGASTAAGLDRLRKSLVGFALHEIEEVDWFETQCTRLAKILRGLARDAERAASAAAGLIEDNNQLIESVENTVRAAPPAAKRKK